jgi:hypothetical protein
MKQDRPWSHWVQAFAYERTLRAEVLAQLN